MEKVKIAICGACLVIVAILGYCYISEKQNEKYEYIVNSAISNIVDTVIEKYPDVREEEILNILRNTKNNKTNILKKYGYLDNENYIKKLEDETVKDGFWQKDAQETGKVLAKIKQLKHVQKVVIQEMLYVIYVEKL